MYYVVKIGRNPGIYNTWSEAEKHVTGYSGAKYKSFKTLIDAEAWLLESKYQPLAKPFPIIVNDTVCPGIEPSDLKMNSSVTCVPLANENKCLSLNKNSVLKYDCSKLNIHKIIYAITENTTKIQPTTWTEYDNTLYIFTDGSYKKSSNKAGTGVFFGESGVSLKLPDGFTNNQAELLAILYALQQIKLNIDQLITYSKPITVISDSMYCINTVTKWMKTWEKNNWQKANGESILNPELIQAINILWHTINKSKNNLSGRVKFEHQNSHTTAPIAKQSREYILWHGNHMADMLATN